MHKIYLVAKETYLREVKTWSYVLMIFAPLLIMLISSGIGYFAAQNSDDDFYVGVVTSDPQLKKLFKNSDFEVYSSTKGAKKDFKDDEIDGYTKLDLKSGKVSATYYSNEKIDKNAQEALNSKLQSFQQRLNIANAKLSPKQLKSLQTSVSFKQEINSKSKANTDSSDSPQETAFFILMLVMYLLVLSYTQVAAQDIATEKGTKIMEMIFSSMPGGAYFDGKVLGIVAEIITQVIIYIICGGVFYLAAPYIPGVDSAFDDIKPFINQILGGIVSWGLLFVTLGIILSIICAAFCGALASKAEDANKAVQPITYLSVIGFIVAMFLQDSPDGLVTKILSYIPFVSSYLMPLRIINSSATNLEAAISALILAGTIVVLYVLIRKIYPNLILQTDDNSLVNNFKRALKSR